MERTWLGGGKTYKQEKKRRQIENHNLRKAVEDIGRGVKERRLFKREKHSREYLSLDCKRFR